MRSTHWVHLQGPRRRPRGHRGQREPGLHRERSRCFHWPADRSMGGPTRSNGTTGCRGVHGHASALRGWQRRTSHLPRHARQRRGLGPLRGTPRADHGCSQTSLGLPGRPRYRLGLRVGTRELFDIPSLQTSTTAGTSRAAWRLTFSSATPTTTHAEANDTGVTGEVHQSTAGNRCQTPLGGHRWASSVHRDNFGRSVSDTVPSLAEPRALSRFPARWSSSECPANLSTRRVAGSEVDGAVGPFEASAHRLTARSDRHGCTAACGCLSGYRANKV
jgi:hypothetical protein